MRAYLNGRIVPEAKARVSVFDRAFLYGDGLFETVRLKNGVAFRWPQHLARLRRGMNYFGLDSPLVTEQLAGAMQELARRNRLPEAVLRLTLSRGVGSRGYSPKGARHPALAMTLHALPQPRTGDSPRWTLRSASLRLRAKDPLAPFKTCNRLLQVMARAEAEAQGADEALLINDAGKVAETACANLFWCEGRTVCTPPLSAGALPGITRAVVLEICRGRGLGVRERNITLAQLENTSGVFATNSAWGVVEVSAIDGVPIPPSPLTGELSGAREALLARECGG
jgi:aminodeoxychorismate lyase